MDNKPTKKRRGLRADKRVQVTLTIGYKPDGKPDRKSFYGRTRAEAMRKKQEYIDRRKQGLSSQELTVGEWVEIFKSLYRANVNEAYLRNDDVPYDRLCKAIGNMYIADVCEADLQKALNEVRGMSVSTIKKYFYTIQKVFKKAKRNKLIGDNPAEDLEMPTGTEGTHRALDRWEIEFIIEHWQAHRSGLWAMLLMLCGLRRGELMGLRWENIDMEARSLSVCEVAVIKGNQATIEERAKTSAGIRVIPICKPLYDALDKTPRSKRNGFVALSASGKQLSESGFTRGWCGFCLTMERLLNNEPLDQRGVRWDLLSEEERTERQKNRTTFLIRPHDMRHTFATILFEAGVSIKDAQYYLGHASTKMTMDLYTHYTEERKKKARIALVGFLDGWLEKDKGKAVEPVKNG